jgi:hypothetical protein
MTRAWCYALAVAAFATAAAGCPSTDQLVNGVRDPDGGGGGLDGDTTGDGGGGDGSEPGVCPDGKKNGQEGCDGTDFGTSTWATEVAPGWVGTRACTPTSAIDDGACDVPPTTWSNLDGNDALWKFQRISDFNADAFGYRGAVFDGQNIYFVPYEGVSGALGLVAQYNLGGFTVSASWKFYDLPSQKSPAAKGYEAS